jgi:dienelactone hydrolase
VELAREWAARGVSVLRMDIGGVGDSDARFGAVDNHPYPDHAVENIASAVRWMKDRARVSRVIVAGLCSGAHASFHAGLAVDGMAGIMVINPFVFYWNPACDVLLVFSEGDPGLDFVKRRYARSLRLLEQRSSNFALRVIPDADHTFTRRAARRRLTGLLSSHLTPRHAERGLSLGVRPVTR